MSEKIWKRLYPYIADENADEDYSAEMAERLCSQVLPLVWSDVLDLEAENERLKKKLSAVHKWLSEPCPPWPDKDSAEQAYEISKMISDD